MTAFGGANLTVINTVVSLLHPFAVAVMVNLTCWLLFVLFVRLPVIIVPLPLDDMPVTFVRLSRLQVKVTPLTFVLGPILIVGMPDPEQMVPFAEVMPETVRRGLGFITTVAWILPRQFLFAAVIVKFMVWFTKVEFLGVPIIGFVFPEAGIPVTALLLSLVQLNAVEPGRGFDRLYAIELIALSEHTS
jgi:hypothetical protein